MVEFELFGRFLVKNCRGLVQIVAYMVLMAAWPDDHHDEAIKPTFSRSWDVGTLGKAHVIWGPQ